MNAFALYILVTYLDYSFIPRNVVVRKISKHHKIASQRKLNLKIDQNQDKLMPFKIPRMCLLNLIPTQIWC